MPKCAMDVKTEGRNIIVTLVNAVDALTAHKEHRTDKTVPVVFASQTLNGIPVVLNDDGKGGTAGMVLAVNAYVPKSECTREQWDAIPLKDKTKKSGLRFKGE